MIGAKQDVLADAARKEKRLLRQVADGRRGVCPDFVEQDVPRLKRIDTQERTRQRALARADRAGDGHQRPGRYVERDIVERKCARARIAEGHVL